MFIVVLLFGSIPSVVAEVVELQEGKIWSLDKTEIRVKRSDSEQGGSCRLKVDAMSDRTLKVGSTWDMGSFSIQIFDADEQRCSLAITPKTEAQEEKNYDLIDTLIIPPSDKLSKEKKYEVGSKTLTIQALQDSVGGFVFIMATPLVEERTNVLTKESSYTFSEQSMMTLLDVVQSIEGTKVKVGLKIHTSTEIVEKQENVQQRIKEEVPEKKKTEKKASKHNGEEIKATDDKKVSQERLHEVFVQEQKKCPPQFCYVNSDFNACLQPRMRISVKDAPSFCDVDGIVKAQKEADQPALYSYECRSNVLKEGKCHAPKKEDEHQSLTKVWTKFKNIFG
ncbi:MAG: hypothetical protein AABX72_04970 [Nanoarchaeota archaeon]